MVNNDSCCFAKILKTIEILQNKTNPICEDEGCDRPFLGPITNLVCYNTRPVQFYTKNGDLFSVTYTENGEIITSNTFRVEKVNDCCCKCRLLITDEQGNITSTNRFITINLKCVCVLKCLNDIALDFI